MLLNPPTQPNGKAFTSSENNESAYGISAGDQKQRDHDGPMHNSSQEVSQTNK